MKLSNTDLAAVLRQRYTNHALLQALAQMLIARPASKALNALALRVVDLPQMPEESYARPLPSRTEAEMQLSLEMQTMKTEYYKSPLHAEIYARRVAWAATTVARLLEYERHGSTHESAATSPSVSTYNGKALNTREGRTGVVDAVNDYLTKRGG